MSEQAMGTCAVTGQVVPEDELVTIHGQRVCAEGKAILLDRLKAGEGLPGELATPSQIRRLGCIILDGLIVGVPFGVANAVLRADSTQPNLATVGLISIIGTAVAIVYFGQMHASRGQTVGKIAGKTKVVNMDGTPITMQTAYIRAIAYTGISVVSGIAYLTGSVGLIGITSLIVGIWGFSNAVACLVDRKFQRTLHDRISGTRVIQLN
jgi:uncharacterized RDD family membrane protein YckC